MRKLLFITVLCIITCFAYSQTGGCFKPNKLKETIKKPIKAPSFALGFGSSILDWGNAFIQIDYNLGKGFYLMSEAGLTFLEGPSYPGADYLHYNKDTYGNYIQVSPRYSFTHNYRVNKEKNTTSHNGEFIGLRASYVYCPKLEKETEFYIVGINAGIRRVLFKRLIIDGSFGITHTNATINNNFTDEYTTSFLIPEINVRLAYLLFYKNQ